MEIVFRLEDLVEEKEDHQVLHFPDPEPGMIK
jgi:hypothetical protein